MSVTLAQDNDRRWHTAYLYDFEEQGSPSETNLLAVGHLSNPFGRSCDHTASFLRRLGSIFFPRTQY